jgi:c(7)-type cytochrome triheme protein
MLGAVTFSHKAHVTDKGLACGECHPDPFGMKKGGMKLVMADMYQGKTCGKCHKTGSSSFDAQANCTRCHIKK